MGIVARTAAWLYMLKKLVMLAYDSSLQLLPNHGERRLLERDNRR
jgi:hypothetical protein